MALRVLLADESVTIKKVMQLALQDFAVEVKTVPVGTDVIEVVRTFGPDIIFADILLQKKNGYEVCGDLKKEPSLRPIPVVLMWSSFMDLDERLATQAGANGRLEKPFDVESLRKLVLEFVPKTRSQRLAHYLQYPESGSKQLKEEELKKQAAVPQPQAAPQTPPPSQAPPSRPPPPPPSQQASSTLPSLAPTPPRRPVIEDVAPPPKPPPLPTPAESKAASSWNMDSFDEIDSHDESLKFDLGGPADFQAPPPVPKAPSGTAKAEAQEPDDDIAFSEFKLTDLSEPEASESSKKEPTLSDEREPWAHQDLARFRLELEPVSVTEDDVRLSVDAGATDARVEPLDIPPYEPIERFRLTEQEKKFSLEVEEEDLLERPQPANRTLQAKHEANTDQLPVLNEDQLERIIRSQSREIIESVVRRVVPDIATEMIREELRRLLDENAGSSFGAKENHR